MAAISQFFSSRHSEEGFHSSSSTDDNSPAYVDRLAFEISTFNFNDAHISEFALGQQKCNSDSGASTADIMEHHTTMKEELGISTIVGAMTGHYQTAQQAPPQLQQPQTMQMPGAWFYEVGSNDDASASPTNELEELALLNLRNVHGVRNVTESVEVPSSEHVAEIVGRQGCKIKALRAKTNTYIKTPVRGEEPVFVVTGRPEDVTEAKREIECAAEHFTQIRASRRHSQGGTPAPGHVTAYVRVPLRVVGLVVGPKGATIKRIQQDTHTYIITPSREREPIFEVTGLPHNVEAARKEIEQHIYQRTGNMPITDPTMSISQYQNELHNSMISNTSLNVSTRSAYGSMATGMRRPSSHVDYQGAAPVVPHGGFGRTLENHPLYGAGGANASMGMLCSYPKTAYSARGSPTAPSPTLFGTSMNGSACGPIGYSSGGSTQPWSTNTNSSYSSIMGLTENELFSNSSRPSALSGASMWASTFGVSSASCASSRFNSQRDEGLGDSPPSNALTSDPFHIMSSIWSDLDNPRENGAPTENASMPLLTA